MRVELSEKAFLQRRHLKIKAKCFHNLWSYVDISLMAMIALSAVQSFAPILIHNAVLFINTSTMHAITKVN